MQSSVSMSDGQPGGPQAGREKSSPEGQAARSLMVKGLGRARTLVMKVKEAAGNVNDCRGEGRKRPGLRLTLSEEVMLIVR